MMDFGMSEAPAWPTADQKAKAAELLESGDVLRASKSLKALAEQFPEDMEIAALYGGALFHSNQFIDAEALLQNVLKRTPLNSVAWGYYYRSLRRQGKLIECAQLNRSDRAVFPGDSYFYGEPFAALGLIGKVDELMDILKDYHAGDAKGLSWVAAAYQAQGDHAAVVEMMEKENSLVSSDIMLQQLMLRSLSQIEGSISDAQKRFLLNVKNDRIKVWSGFELARYMDVSSSNDVLDGESERPFNIEPTPYCPKITGLSEVNIGDDVGNCLGAGFSVPKIERESLRENIRELLSTITDLREDGVFERQVTNIDAVRRRYGAVARDPVQFLSTGRCGTIGLYKLLCRSRYVLPYHTLGWQLIPSDRNHMLYRILTRQYDRDVLIRIFIGYLENRSAELMYAYRLGRTPVIINHWDTVFSPLLAVVFPESSFLHVYRSDDKVFESLYTKNQFQNEQLHYCQFDDSFPEGRFLLRYEDRPVEEEIAWYLYITREFSSAFRDVIGNERSGGIASEDLFQARMEEYELLQGLMPLNDLSYLDYSEHYSKPINSKLEKQQDPAGWQGRKERFRSSIEKLNQSGEF